MLKQFSSSNNTKRDFRTLIVSVAIIAVLVGFDRLTKIMVVAEIPFKESRPWLRIGNFGLINFTHVQNDGAAFGILSGQQLFLIIVTSVFIAVAFSVLVIGTLTGKMKDKRLIIAITFIVSGGLGNLIDRISQGYVVDFIELKFIKFAIFNFADICACVGAGLLFWIVLQEEIREYKARRACEVETEDDDPAESEEA